jgi:hypothetical protein
VAVLLSRLRTVDGVTRVSLAKSDRPEQALQSGGSTSAGSSGTGCGAGRPPTFDIVMFFERDKVPATVQDVTVAAPAAAAAAAGASATPASTPTSTPAG